MGSRRREWLVLGAFVIVIALNAWWWAGSWGSHPAGRTTRPQAERFDPAVANRWPAPTPFSGEKHEEPEGKKGEQATLEGRVVRLSDGEAIPGASVRWEEGPSGKIQTDENGRFRLSLPYRGPSFTLYVQHLDYTPVTFLSQGELPNPLELPLPDHLSYGVKVLNAQTGESLAGATITVSEPEGPPLQGARTGPDGCGVLPLPPLRITLRADAPPRRTLELLSFRIDVRCPGFTAATRWVGLQAYDTGSRPVLFLLEPALTREGVVLDPTGRPVPFARVCWSWLVRKGLFASKDWRETVADASGRFTWHAPCVLWETVLVASADGFAPGWTLYRAGEIESGKPFAVKLNELCTFAGRIVDEEGKGVAGVSVKIFPVDRPSYWNNVEFLIGRFVEPKLFVARTDRNGAFQIEGVPAGRYAVRWLHRTMAASREGEREVVLPRLTPWVGTATKGEELHGRMITENGQPVPGGRVVLRVSDPGIANGWRPVAPTHILYDGEGGFLAFGLEKAKHLIMARAAGLRSEAIQVDSFGEEVVLILKPAPEQNDTQGTRLVFNLTVEGAAPEFSWVNFWYAREGSSRYQPAALRVERGVGVAQGIPPGTYDVLVAAYGFAPVELHSIKVPAAGPISIQLTPAPFVRGRINVSSGRPPRFLEILDSAGRQLHKCIVDPQGGIIIPGIVKGVYRCVGTRNGRVTHVSVGDVLISPPGPVQIQLVEVNEKKKNESVRRTSGSKVGRQG